MTRQLTEQTRPIQMLRRLRALFLAAGVGMFESDQARQQFSPGD